MKNLSRHLFILCGLTTLFASFSIFAQVPTIYSTDRRSGNAHEIVTISGSDFGTDPSILNVSFGSSKSVIQYLSPHTIEAVVPSGATFSNISVTNTASGLSGYSNEQFFLAYKGADNFTGNHLEDQLDFDAEPGLYDFCLCDLDADGKNDIAATNQDANLFTILRNTTTSPGSGAINFTKVPLDLQTGTLHAKCGDLNGDGKPDLIISEGSNGTLLFILKNLSTGPGHISFEKIALDISNTKVKRLAIADMDADGKPEIIITNQTGNTVTILKNNSSQSNIIFSNAQRHDIRFTDVAEDRGFDGLAVQDLNGDGKPDIVTSQFQRAVSNLYVIPNKSTSGDLSLGEVIKYDLSGTAVSVEITDLDNDKKPDITVSLLLNSSMAIFRNISDEKVIKFETPVHLPTQLNPYGFDFGDINGDSKIDMVVASIETKSINVFLNESSPGSFQFSTVSKDATYIQRHLLVGDMDGDSKPDVCFTSIDDNNRQIPASKISIFRNSNCVKPVIDEEAELRLCHGSSVTLSTALNAGLQYKWFKNNVEISFQTASITVTDEGSYSVKTTSVEGCNLTSNAVMVTFENDSFNTTTSINDPGPVCSGTDLTLSITNDIGATAYKWSGPDNYHAEGGTAQPAVKDFNAAKAGRYTLKVYGGSCLAQTTSIVVDAISVPAFHLNTRPDEFVCSGESKTIIIDPAPENYAYQWYEKNGGALDGQTNHQLNVNVSGEYYAIATGEIACATVQTKSTKIHFTSAPVVDFSADGSHCTGNNIEFFNKTTAEVSAPLDFFWNFRDGDVSMDKDPIHSFVADQSYTVTLKASYPDGQCATEKSRTIDIKQAPTISIINDANIYSICDGGELMLQVEGIFDFYQWNTGESTRAIQVTEPGDYSVAITTTEGCIGLASKTVEAFPIPEVFVTADPEEVVAGEKSQLNAEGLIEYIWSPATTLNEIKISNPVAMPATTTSYVVTGKDENGCTGTASIEVSVRGELASRKISPRKYFSPNNDGINSKWTVEKILNYPQCAVTIYDDKGIEVYHAQPYTNDWDGTINGNDLPEGVYFYLIRCDGEENSPVTGSVTLLR